MKRIYNTPTYNFNQTKRVLGAGEPVARVSASNGSASNGSASNGSMARGLVAGIINMAIISALLLLPASCARTFDEPEAFVPANFQPTHTIAQLKAMRAGGPTEVLDDITISGKVVSSDAEGNFYRSFFIQDETGGIEIKIGKTNLQSYYKEGQTIYVKARHLMLGSYGGMVSIGERSLEPRYENGFIDTDLRIKETIIRGTAGPKVAPYEITSQSQITDSRLGTLVTLKNAKLTRRNMATWAQKASGNIEAVYGEHTFQIGTRNVLVRTSGYAKFASEPAPSLNSYADVTGILTKYNTTYQLVLNSLDGVVLK
ncbi:MAG: DUF5689 domain-containing protein [Bacteroidales bacterium]|nr:DUF5689 domain-containing protein [Bacteroidales bacterium]MDD2425293.1 DUF5689 domain-containing protein [Bacteroidales bacterium]MDD3989653.1 DUF5689 domain-containing protein [Bacteroidales bacterium]MDD4639454.1 DUF5689 domain-containing protein [Bacteroidales bacterium]